MRHFEFKVGDTVNHTYKRKKEPVEIIDIDILDRKTPYYVKFSHGGTMWLNERYLSKFNA